MRLIDCDTNHFAILTSWFETEAEVVQGGGLDGSFPLCDEQLRAMLADGDHVPPRRRCWMAEHTSEIVGHAQLGYDWRNGNAVLSRVAMAPAARGRGLAKMLVRRVVDEALRSPHVVRVELNVYDWNAPAIRTYEAVGFVREGKRRASVRVGDERWNTVIMGLLRHKWGVPANLRERPAPRPRRSG